MKKTIYRDIIQVADTVDLKIPGFLRVLHVSNERLRDSDYRDIEFWYERDWNDHELYPVRLHIEGTGHPIEHSGEYVGSVISANGNLVWHVYCEYPIRGHEGETA